jgi:hypothetical protein
MRTLFIFIIASALCLTAKADITIPYQANSLYIFTNTTFSSNVTATTVFTNYQGTLVSLNHTFQFNYTATGSNSTVVNLDRTTDFTANNWVPVWTNTWGVNTNVDYTYAGKWYQFRTRVNMQATNATLSQNYMAQ